MQLTEWLLYQLQVALLLIGLTKISLKKNSVLTTRLYRIVSYDAGPGENAAKHILEYISTD
jgi:hypothetical protein